MARPPRATDRSSIGSTSRPASPSGSGAPTAPALAAWWHLTDDDGAQVILSRETPTDPPQLYATSFASKAERHLTHFTHPVPELAKVKKQLIKWKRKDGLELSGM